ncbi:MAG: arsenate reductase ArsC [Candidatus Anammoxibacter sp.]
MKKKVLFVCTHNSARSQMAEGLMNALHSDQYEAYSAGTEPSVVNPFAIKALAEMDIDISTHCSRNVDEFKDTEFDYVVTVCDNAKESCPVFSSVGKAIHKSFGDPSHLEKTDEGKLKAFITVRDEIKLWIYETFCK